jgi:hypothetical protein
MTPSVCTLVNAAEPPVAMATIEAVNPKVTVHGLARGVCRALDRAARHGAGADGGVLQHRVLELNSRGIGLERDSL